MTTSQGDKICKETSALGRVALEMWKSAVNRRSLFKPFGHNYCMNYSNHQLILMKVKLKRCLLIQQDKNKAGLKMCYEPDRAYQNQAHSILMSHLAFHKKKRKKVGRVLNIMCMQGLKIFPHLKGAVLTYDEKLFFLLLFFKKTYKTNKTCNLVKLLHIASN